MSGLRVLCGDARTMVATRNMRNDMGRIFTRCRRIDAVAFAWRDMINTMMESNVKNSPVRGNVGLGDRRT
jgi:hypothetical protein